MGECGVLQVTVGDRVFSLEPDDSVAESPTATKNHEEQVTHSEKIRHMVSK